MLLLFKLIKDEQKKRDAKFARRDKRKAARAAERARRAKARSAKAAKEDKAGATCCFYTPVQWMSPYLLWAAGEKRCRLSPQAAAKEAKAKAKADALAEVRSADVPRKDLWSLHHRGVTALLLARGAPRDRGGEEGRGARGDRGQGEGEVSTHRSLVRCVF